uniref:Secreted protein n=1 Tax=Macrostomum lignano TaxID=282301 RepID=A0A1I8FAB5_9PLAT
LTFSGGFSFLQVHRYDAECPSGRPGSSPSARNAEASMKQILQQQRPATAEGCIMLQMRATAFNSFVLLPLLLLLSRGGSACKRAAALPLPVELRPESIGTSSVQAAAATFRGKSGATRDRGRCRAHGSRNCGGQERLTPAKRFYHDPIRSSRSGQVGLRRPGRSSAGQHQAKKAKYLAGGDAGRSARSCGLSRGGVIMENVG